MDPGVLIALAGGFVTIATGLFAALTAEWRKSVKRESDAKDALIEFIKVELSTAVADRRNLEQRLQLFMDTVKEQTRVLERSVALSEKLYARLDRNPAARERSTDA